MEETAGRHKEGMHCASQMLNTGAAAGYTALVECKATG
jgi:hypothetical protein